jgi:hypothetical protein
MATETLWGLLVLDPDVAKTLSDETLGQANLGLLGLKL